MSDIKIMDKTMWKITGVACGAALILILAWTALCHFYLTPALAALAAMP